MTNHTFTETITASCPTCGVDFDFDHERDRYPELDSYDPWAERLAGQLLEATLGDQQCWRWDLLTPEQRLLVGGQPQLDALKDWAEQARSLRP